MESKIEINSLLEFIGYIEVMTKLEEEKEPLKKYYYRGENNVFPKRIPSIYRSNENKAIYQRLVNEGSREYYLELFEELGWSISNFGNKMFEQMIEVQHYGAVTNIIDISINPMVAMFFACYGSDNTDGKVYGYLANENIEEHYFNRKISIMTALNFVDRKLLDSFVTMFDELLLLNTLKNDNYNGIFFSEISLHKYTARKITDSILLVIQTGNFECFRKEKREGGVILGTFTDYRKYDNPSDNVNSHDDINWGYFNSLDLIIQPPFRIPFTTYRFGYSVDKKDIVINNDHESTAEAIGEIQYFVRKIFKENDSEIDYFSFLNNHTDLINQQIELLTTMEEIMTEFLKQVSEYSGLKEELKYPFEIYKIIKRSYIVKASKINERIKNQRGAFIVPGYISTLGKDIKQIQTELDDSIRSTVNSIVEFTIPSESKPIILQQLRLIGIDEGFIYPEIGNVAKAVLEKYK